jgi:hypothetical protein
MLSVSSQIQFSHTRRVCEDGEPAYINDSQRMQPGAFSGEETSLYEHM